MTAPLTLFISSIKFIGFLALPKKMMVKRREAEVQWKMNSFHIYISFQLLALLSSIVVV